MKKILIATDFSSAAQNASEYAIKLAKEMKAEVLLMNVYHMPIPIREDITMEIDFSEIQKMKEENLKKEAERLFNKTGVKVNCMTKYGFAVDEIIAESSGAIMTVMGMKNAGLSQTLLGSIANSVLKQIKKPLLIIPEKAEFHFPDKVVLAYEYDPKTDKRGAVESLKCFLSPFSSEIAVVNVLPEDETIEFGGRKQEQMIANASLSEGDCHFVKNNHIVEGIANFVSEQQADMLTLIHQHRTKLLDKLFHKSISKEMAIHTEIPLLVLPFHRQPGDHVYKSCSNCLNPEFCYPEA